MRFSRGSRLDIGIDRCRIAVTALSEALPCLASDQDLDIDLHLVYMKQLSIVSDQR